MPARRMPLSVYRIREQIDGKTVSKPEDAVAGVDDLEVRELPAGRGVSGTLFIEQPEGVRPAWAAFLEQGFGRLGVITDNVMNSAVLVAKVKVGTKDCFFAIPFGTGRHLLRRGSYQWNYGLRVALNTVYPGGPVKNPEEGRIRSVDAKTVAATTLYTRRQASRWADFETFDVDVNRDLLKSVTGKPASKDAWGSRLTGGDALSLLLPVEFSDLKGLLQRIERTFRRRDYTKEFAWIDNLRTVRDPAILEDLHARIVDQLRAKQFAQLELAPPELVEWDDIGSFRYSVNADQPFDDLRVGDYVSLLDSLDELKNLTFEDLRKNHWIEVRDTAGELLGDWSVLECLSGELTVRNTHYLLDGGDFFEIATGYVKELNAYMAALEESALALPKSPVKEQEGAYNIKAAKALGSLLMDKKTVNLSAHTTAIEVCDIFTEDGKFVHVKKGSGSSCLSHLFAQGAVSADLFLMSQEFRTKAKAKIQEQQAVKDAPRGNFAAFDVDGIEPDDYTVVYAMIMNWRDKSIVDSLPFFSKVNLRRQSEDLRRMGYRVTYKRIEIV